MIAKEIEKLEELLKQKRQEYDDQTNVGNNTEKQIEYNLTFNKIR